MLAGAVDRIPLDSGDASAPFTERTGDLRSTARIADAASDPEPTKSDTPGTASSSRDDASSTFYRAAETLRREASDVDRTDLRLRSGDDAEPDAERRDAPDPVEITQVLSTIADVLDEGIALARAVTLTNDRDAAARTGAAAADRSPARRRDLPTASGTRDRGTQEEGDRLYTVKIPLVPSDRVLWMAVDGKGDLNRALAIRAWQGALQEGGVRISLMELGWAYDQMGITTAKSRNELTPRDDWGKARTDDAWRRDIDAARAAGRDTIDYGILTPSTGIRLLYDKVIALREGKAREYREFIENVRASPDIGLQLIAAFYTAQVNAFVNLANAGISAATVGVRHAPRLFGGKAIPAPEIPKVPYFGDWGKKYGQGLFEPSADLAVQVLLLRGGPSFLKLFQGSGATGAIVRGGTRLVEGGMAFELSRNAYDAANQAIEVLQSDAPISEKLGAVARAVGLGTLLAMSSRGRRSGGERDASVLVGMGKRSRGSGAGGGQVPSAPGRRAAHDLNAEGDRLDVAADGAIRTARASRRPAIDAADLGRIGSVATQGAFRTELTAVLRADRNHPLRFLLTSRGGLRSSWGKRHSTLVMSPEIVEAGHVVSKKALTGAERGTDRFVVMSAWRNRVIGGTVERPRTLIHAKVESALAIGGIPVDPATARDWVARGLMPAEVLAGARKITF